MISQHVPGVTVDIRGLAGARLPENFKDGRNLREILEANGKTIANGFVETGIVRIRDQCLRGECVPRLVQGERSPQASDPALPSPLPQRA